ncbi:MAG: endonuclease V [Acidilobaceae archaeon]
MKTYCREISSRFNVSRAIKAQYILSKLLILEALRDKIETITGLDVSYVRLDNREVGLGVAVIVEYPRLKVMKCNYYIREVCIPYIPGLLAFREMEILAPLLSNLIESYNIDLLMVDGHGISHPRGFGIASHIGLAFNKSSIGVAKSKLVGREEFIGGRRLLVHDNKVIGAIIETGKGRIYVSPGYKITLEDAIEIVRATIKPDSILPEPLRLADSISRTLKREVSIEKLENPMVRECKLSTLV